MLQVLSYKTMQYCFRSNVMNNKIVFWTNTTKGGYIYIFVLMSVATHFPWAQLTYKTQQNLSMQCKMCLSDTMHVFSCGKSAEQKRPTVLVKGGCKLSGNCTTTVSCYNHHCTVSLTHVMVHNTPHHVDAYYNFKSWVFTYD
jgi:hypothetical protein